MTKKSSSKTTESSEQSLLQFLVFFLIVGVASSSPISNDLVQPHGSIGRSILQTKTPCPSNYLRTVQYSYVINRCNLFSSPTYTEEKCCEPVRTTICPVVNETENNTTDCFDQFMKYLYLSDPSYPRGLFEKLCSNEYLHPKDCPVADDNGFSGNGVARGSASSSFILMTMIFAGLAL